LIFPVRPVDEDLGPLPVKPSQPSLSEEEEWTIRELFHERMVPKLQSLQARIGTISCAFAGDRYTTWALHFKSLGSGFTIVELEYDPDACALDLDL
jgi:hypothetical protein